MGEMPGPGLTGGRWDETWRDQEQAADFDLSPFAFYRVCSVRSVDGSPTTAFTVLECEGSRRLGSRPRRYLLTGQANGSLAMWDLTTAMDGLGQAPGISHLTLHTVQAPHSPRTLTHSTYFHRVSLPKALPLAHFPALQPLLVLVFPPLSHGL